MKDVVRYIGFILFGVAMFVYGFILGRTTILDDADSVRRQAAIAGVGRWELDDISGKARFVWGEKKR